MPNLFEVYCILIDAHIDCFPTKSGVDLVSRGQTAFFPLWWRKKGSGELLLADLCRESPDFGDC